MKAALEEWKYYKERRIRLKLPKLEKSKAYHLTYRFGLFRWRLHLLRWRLHLLRWRLHLLRRGLHAFLLWRWLHFIGILWLLIAHFILLHSGGLSCLAWVGSGFPLYLLLPLQCKKTYSRDRSTYYCMPAPPQIEIFPLKLTSSVSWIIVLHCDLFTIRFIEALLVSLSTVEMDVESWLQSIVFSISSFSSTNFMGVACFRFWKHIAWTFRWWSTKEKGCKKTGCKRPRGMCRGTEWQTSYHNCGQPQQSPL